MPLSFWSLLNFQLSLYLMKKSHCISLWYCYKIIPHFLFFFLLILTFSLMILALYKRAKKNMEYWKTFVIRHHVLIWKFPYISDQFHTFPVSLCLRFIYSYFRCVVVCLICIYTMQCAYYARGGQKRELESPEVKS